MCLCFCVLCPLHNNDSILDKTIHKEYFMFMCWKINFTSVKNQILMHFGNENKYKSHFHLLTVIDYLESPLISTKSSFMFVHWRGFFGCTSCCEWTICIDVWGITSPCIFFVMSLLITHTVVRQIIYAITWVVTHPIPVLPFLISINPQRCGCFQSH